MSSPSVVTNVLYPPGRWVSGDIYESKQKEDNKGQPRFYPANHAKRPNEPMMECFFGIAIPKAPNQTAAALAAMGLPGFKCGWAVRPQGWDQQNGGAPYWGEQIWLEAQKGFPHYVVNGQPNFPANFAWKIADGDDPTPVGDSKIPLSAREGHAGCWIVYLKSGTPPKVYDDSGKPLLDKGILKRGWWLEVYGSVSGNGETQKPGVYLNHSMVSYRAPDKEIVMGPDPTKVGFGRFALPAGVSAQPLGASTNFPAAGLPGGLPLGGLPAQGAGFPNAQGPVGVGAPAGLPVGGGPTQPVGFAPALGGAPAGLPTASHAPIYPSNGPLVGGAPAGFPQSGAMPVVGGQGAYAPSGVAGSLPVGAPGMPTGVQAHTGFLQPQSGVGAAPTAPSAPVGPVLSPALRAQGVTWEQMAQANWTLEAARAAGHVVG